MLLGIRAELEALRRRHLAALELMGERDEELEELRADIVDLKEMYREQVNLLANKLKGGTNGYDFKSVKRWTTQRKLGYCLIECDKIFVLIHKETHWCLAVINKKDEKFQYLDSLKGMDKQVMKILLQWSDETECNSCTQ